MQYSQGNSPIGEQADFWRVRQVLPAAAHFSPRSGLRVRFTALLRAAAAAGEELRTAVGDSALRCAVVEEQQQKQTSPKRDADDAGSRHCPPHDQLRGPGSAHDIANVSIFVLMSCNISDE